MCNAIIVVIIVTIVSFSVLVYGIRFNTAQFTIIGAGLLVCCFGIGWVRILSNTPCTYDMIEAKSVHVVKGLKTVVVESDRGTKMYYSHEAYVKMDSTTKFTYQYPRNHYGRRIGRETVNVVYKNDLAKLKNE